jgi:hypothetical protein
MPEQRPVFHVMATGWEHPAWAGEFYPEDLPAAWRLTYYANEFPGVLLSQPDWRSLEPASLSAWADDVSGSFRFYLELISPLEPQEGAHLARCLGGNFGGFVVASAKIRQIAGQWGKQQSDWGIYTCYPVSGAGLAMGEPPLDESRLACRIASADLADLKSQRRLLERLASQVTGRAEVLLFLEGTPPGIEKIRNLRVLAQLLGIA